MCKLVYKFEDYTYLNLIKNDQTINEQGILEVIV